MSEQPQSAPASALPVRLRELARLLRDADHLAPEAQQSLARLTDELAKAMTASGIPSAEEVQLADLTGQLIQSLHNGEVAPAPATRHRLQEAILAAETRAPLAAGLARQMLDALANLGI